MAACPAPAFAEDAFPNQPDALTPEELQAAAAANAGAPGLKLHSSGKRRPGHPMPAYATFAGPAADLGAGVVVRQRVICNFWQQGPWRCGEPHQSYELQADGRTHLFTYRAVGVPQASPQLLREIADYVASPCFADQLRDLSDGKAPADNRDIMDVEQHADTLIFRTDMTQNPNSYSVRRSEGPCRFQLANARLGGGGMFPSAGITKAAERARLEAARTAPVTASKQQERTQQQQGTHPPIDLSAPASKIPAFQKLTDMLANLFILLNLASALLAVGLPFALLEKGRRAAARVAVGLAGLATLFAFGLVACLHLAGITDTGFSLILVVPATLLTWLAGVGWRIAAIRPERAAPPRPAA